jgi:hypothetical protein
MSFLDLAVFTVISSIEYIAILVLIFTVFRFEFGYLKYHMVFVALALSYVSYSMRTENLSAYVPFVQILILIILIWLVIKVHPIYATIMGTLGYLSYGLIQGILVYIARESGFQLEAMTWPMAGVALLSAASTFGISSLLRSRNLGFAFIPSQEERKSTVKSKETTALIIVSLFSVVGAGIMYIFTLLKTEPLYMFIIILILVISVGILLFLSTIKERKFFS